jgi:hypothetical protein
LFLLFFFPHWGTSIYCMHRPSKERKRKNR